jgi:hypothetical protein
VLLFERFGVGGALPELTHYPNENTNVTSQFKPAWESTVTSLRRDGLIGILYQDPMFGSFRPIAFQCELGFQHPLMVEARQYAKL